MLLPTVLEQVSNASFAYHTGLALKLIQERCSVVLLILAALIHRLIL